MRVLEKLKDPKVQKELEPLLKEFIEVEKKDDQENREAALVIFGAIFFLALLSYGGPIIEKFFDNNKSSYAPINLVIK